MGVQAFYAVKRLNLCLYSWATKDLRIVQCLCFPTDLVFVKSPSEAAALMAGVSGPTVSDKILLGLDPLGSGWLSHPPRTTQNPGSSK